MGLIHAYTGPNLYSFKVWGGCYDAYWRTIANSRVSVASENGEPVSPKLYTNIHHHHHTNNNNTAKLRFLPPPHLLLQLTLLEILSTNKTEGTLKVVCDSDLIFLFVLGVQNSWHR